jgi:predicted lipase
MILRVTAMALLSLLCFVSDTEADSLPDSAASVISVNPLPTSQRILRKKAVLSVNKSLLEAAQASEKSYKPSTKSNDWREFLIKRPKALFGSSETRVLIRVDAERKTVEVVVRGTANLDDALRDLNIKAVRDEHLGIPIHSGFKNIAEGVVDKLHETISKEGLSNYHFRLYGHSLGGAVAAIVAMHLHQEEKVVDLVVTFGAPRFTTNEGAHKYQGLNRITYRVVRCDDVVPFLPPPNFFGWSNEGYQANGNLLLLLKKPYFDYSEGIDIERDFMAQLRTEFANSKSNEKLAFGHRISNYSRSVWWLSSNGRLAMADPGDIVPVSYTLSMQNDYCSPKLGE